MIRLVSDTISREDIDALCGWLQAGPGVPRLTKGELTLELERQWALKVGTEFSVFVNSGSSAILLTLAALKYMQAGPKIAVPALSWSTDLGSALLLDYDTVLVDCNLEDLSVDLTHLEHVFKHERPDILLLVEVLGLVPDMAAITQLCEKYNVLLLEDACESMGSKYRGRPLGSFGEASMFSMFFGHHVSTIEGGFINTNNPLLYDMLIMMRSHGWNRDLAPETQAEMRKNYEISEFDDAYTFYVPGMNLRSTDLQAFLGLRAIDKLDSFAEARLMNFNRMHQAFEPYSNLRLRNDGRDFISNFAYPIARNDRQRLVKLFKDRVEIRPLIAGNIAEHPVWTERNGRTDYLPNATTLHKTGFYLPNHQDISPGDIELMGKILSD